jgi:hypothetical protein
LLLVSANAGARNSSRGAQAEALRHYCEERSDTAIQQERAKAPSKRRTLDGFDATRDDEASAMTG